MNNLNGLQKRGSAEENVWAKNRECAELELIRLELEADTLAILAKTV